METILKHLEEIVDAWIKLEKRLGLRKIFGYVCLVGLILIAINIKTVTLSTLEFINEMQEELHNIKMEKRDQLLTELYPILVEYRTAVNADRILYFEYHNSKENLVGIPFKFMDLVTQSSKYGTPNLDPVNYSDINVGVITNLYDEMSLGDKDVIYCKGPEEYGEFQAKYPGAMDLFVCPNPAHVHRLAFVSIPGVHQPIGMIVLEWTGEDEYINVPLVDKTNGKLMPVINALILSKR